MDTVTPSVSPFELHQRLGTRAAPLIVDVRRRPAFEEDDSFIAGATWRDPFTVSEWERFLPRHRDIVVYCVHGHEVSRNACGALRAAGLDASYLDGGIAAWRQSGAPTVRRDPSLPIPSAMNAPSRWITRERPRIDRIACPWLIRRFIDPLAEFDYVPAANVVSEATARGAIAYDVPDVRFTHRGEECSFDALIADFALVDAGLERLATIVRGADTGRPDLAPQCAGLVAVSIGLGANFSNDLEMLEHGMVVYDALYAWCRRGAGAATRKPGP